MDNIYLYGPPGSGKTTVGKILAEALARPFVDLDDVITARAGMTIPKIFGQQGEAAFRRYELDALVSVADGTSGPCIASLGGGALLAQDARQVAERSGRILCLQASAPVILERIQPQSNERPLLAGGEISSEERLTRLLDTRREHYNSFLLRLNTDFLDPQSAAWQAMVRLGRFHVRGMGAGYDVIVQPGILDGLGEIMKQQGLKGPVAVASDENVAKLYAQQVAASLQSAGYRVELVIIPAGEDFKTIETIQRLWAGFVKARLDRGSTVLALGGGVTGDLTGFAAATFLRGVSWVNVPTTLLSMVDSSLGGKTGFDLPQGKNLVGAFHPPRLVAADPMVLKSLPVRELRGGLAETIKHGVIDDPALFDLCERGEQAAAADLDALVRRAMAVKVKVIEVDPYEKGIRQALNLGHTVGHGVELASGFSLSHGESVAIGMAVEARLAEMLGVAEPGLAERLCGAIRALNLPVEIPAGLSRERVVDAMQMDKKRAAGKVRFALPEQVGTVRVGVEIEDWQSKIFEL